MHRVIEQSLEEYLEGSATPEFTSHLRACEQCRRELSAIQETSRLFTDLRSEEIFEPSPSFTARVLVQVGETRAMSVPSFWSLFSLNPTFGKRVAFAALLLLGVIGSYVVNQERDYAAGPPSIELVMNDNQPAQVPASDSDRMLVKLTSYEP